MNSGMYSALSGNITAMKRLEVISNNLANANTPGFKKDKMSFESMLNVPENRPAVPDGTTADPLLQKNSVYVDYSPGPVAQTGNPLDLAINGDGFFVVNTPNGPAYTRQGNFRMSVDGTLETVDGYPVMGQAGPIKIQGSKVAIDGQGVVNVDGVPAGTITVVDFPKPYNLIKGEGTLFTPANPQAAPQAATAAIRQGHLEGSNVETIGEMVRMIETNRYFEACSKVVQGYDAMASKATTDLGRLA
ncbi:MAG TPA: flagellar basal-body rod protein FlgF [Desulfuromonadaceae bacterium]